MIQTGLHVLWYDNGQKRFEENRKNGQPDGEFTKWHKNGQKRSEGTFRNVKKHGLFTKWYDTGQKRWEGMWNNNKLITETYWDEKGNII